MSVCIKGFILIDFGKLATPPCFCPLVPEPLEKNTRSRSLKKITRLSSTLLHTLVTYLCRIINLGNVFILYILGDQIEDCRDLSSLYYMLPFQVIISRGGGGYPDISGSTRTKKCVSSLTVY